jgi:ABC-2 type transport system permease protein
VAFIALLFTLVYVFSISLLSTGDIDAGGIAGSYIGLLMLCGVFASIGVFTSSLQSNAVISFLLSALMCYIVYAFFSSLAKLELFQSGSGYYVSLIGIQTHYENMSKGFIDSRDLIYFISLISFFLFLTIEKIKSR